MEKKTYSTISKTRFDGLRSLLFVSFILESIDFTAFSVMIDFNRLRLTIPYVMRQPNILGYLLYSYSLFSMILTIKKYLMGYFLSIFTPKRRISSDFWYTYWVTKSFRKGSGLLFNCIFSFLQCTLLNVNLLFVYFRWVMSFNAKWEILLSYMKLTPTTPNFCANYWKASKLRHTTQKAHYF